jgi:hypothetical protein
MASNANDATLVFQLSLYSVGLSFAMCPLHVSTMQSSMKRTMMGNRSAEECHHVAPAPDYPGTKPNKEDKINLSSLQATAAVSVLVHTIVT